ncbi:MAG: D-alanyl-D-alanine carboxypeptidase/D-alanyl-D-alanine endopeptidase [Mycobacteriales bacterium]
MRNHWSVRRIRTPTLACLAAAGVALGTTAWGAAGAAALSPLDPAAPVPTPAQVAAVVAGPLADPALGPLVTGEVVDLATGQVLFDQGAATPVMAASVTKFAVTTAALTVLGPEDRLVTALDEVGQVRAGVLHGDLVLVGGGDMLLTAGPGGGYPPPARLADLAAAVAGEGIHQVTGSVIADPALFSGPPTAPGWHVRYFTGGSVAPVRALADDDGLVVPDLATTARVPDPARAAATHLLVDLVADGVTVAGPVVDGTLPAGARPLASVSSPPLAGLVESMLARSDNDMAESLGRLVALRVGQPASFAGESVAVPQVLSRLGLDTSGLTLYDVSGLSRLDRVPVSLVIALIRLAADPAHPELRSMLTGLPVAAFSGTLAGRFTSPGARPGAGLVHAKTGTLLGVTSIAGTVVDADGRLLAFAFVSNSVASYRGAESAVDRAAAALEQL